MATACPWDSRWRDMKLELVSGPVAVVEGTGGAQLKRIAGRGDVFQMQQGAALEDAPDGGQVAPGDFRRGAFDGPEKGGILDGGDLDGFGNAVEQEGEGQGLQKTSVVQDGPGGGQRCQGGFWSLQN